jgi:hypothetical protein
MQLGRPASSPAPVPFQLVPLQTSRAFQSRHIHRKNRLSRPKRCSTPLNPFLKISVYGRELTSEARIGEAGNRCCLRTANVPPRRRRPTMAHERDWASSNPRCRVHVDSGSLISVCAITASAAITFELTTQAVGRHICWGALFLREYNEKARRTSTGIDLSCRAPKSIHAASQRRRCTSRTQ